MSQNPLLQKDILTAMINFHSQKSSDFKQLLLVCKLWNKTYTDKYKELLKKEKEAYLRSLIYSGSIGPIGPTGATGCIGISGIIGPIGYYGIMGPIGAIGPTGATGARGTVELVGQYRRVGRTYSA